MHNIFTDLRDSLFPNTNSYLTSGSGKSNIILSAPHGGNIKPISIPTRKYGNRSRDTYTRDLIIRVTELLREKPYFIYSNIHRSRIDLNRNIEEACQGNKKAEDIWRNWNYFLHASLNEVRYYHKKGLYIDIHSHNNSDMFEIGYGLNVRDYIHLLNNDKIPTKNSTMHELKEYSTSEYTTEFSILFGENSIPYQLERYGYKVLIPKNDKDFLNGGWNIKTNHGNGIGSMQIECPIPVLKDNLESVAYVLTKAIENFSKQFLAEK